MSSTLSPSGERNFTIPELNCWTSDRLLTFYIESGRKLRTKNLFYMIFVLKSIKELHILNFLLARPHCPIPTAFSRNEEVILCHVTEKIGHCVIL